MEYSILSANGFTSTGASNGVATTSSKGAAPTQGVGSKVKVAGAMAAGFVGAVFVL